MIRHSSSRSVIQVGVLLIALMAVWSIVGCGKDSSTEGGGAVPATGSEPGGPRVSGGRDASGNYSIEPDFTPLFEGQNLSGWVFGKTALDGQTATPDYRFQAKDGVIVVAARGKDGKSGTKEIVSSRVFDKDFILRLEFRAAQEATGAVVVRNHAVPVGDYIRRNEQPQLKSFKNDDWNELQVTVRQVTRADGKALKETDHLEASFQNGKAKARLNGHDIDPNAITVRIEGQPRCNGESLRYYGSFAVGSKGTVALRATSGKLEFRKIRFKIIE